MRGTRRPVEAQTIETPLDAPAPTPNPEFLIKKIFEGDEQSNKKLYDEFIKDFHEIGDHYNKHNLFFAKTALVELLNRMKDQGFSKTELTVRILEVLADINLKVRQPKEATYCFEQVATIFADNKNVSNRDQKVTDPEHAEWVSKHFDQIQARAYYNLAVLKLEYEPNLASVIIHDKLFMPEISGLLPHHEQGMLQEFSAISTCLEAVMNSKLQKSNPGWRKNPDEESIDPLQDSFNALTRIGEQIFEHGVSAEFSNTLSLCLYHRINLSDLGLEQALDKEIYLFENEFFQTTRMGEVSFEEILKHNFFQTPMIKVLTSDLDYEFYQFENLGHFTALFFDGQNDGFFDEVTDLHIKMLANLSYFLMQSGRKSHRGIGLKFLNIANYLVKKGRQINEFHFQNTYVKFLYGVYFLDSGDFKSGEKVINGIQEETSVEDYKTDTFKIFGLQLLASASKAKKDNAYVIFIPSNKNIV